MTRGALVGYLARQYGELATAAGWADWGLAVDATWRMLGVAEADVPHAEVDDGLTQDALALADYYALRALVRVLSTFADIRAGNSTLPVSKARSQIFVQTKILLDDTKKAVPARYAVEGGDFALGKLQLDILEPAFTGLVPFPYF